MSNEESFVRKMDDVTITPASITIVPDLYYQSVGSVAVSSPDISLSASATYDISTSWRILGSLDVDLNTSWNTGENAWFWYRVEGYCTPVTCDDMGVQYGGCSHMTFVTTVSARNLTELCDTLSNPKINAPANLILSSIKRYSRPVFKNQILPGQCNVLEDVEYCQIPECMTYCPEPSATYAPDFANLVLPRPAPAEDEGAVDPEFVRDKYLSDLSEIEDALLATASPSASVLGIGYEYGEANINYDMQVPTDFVSACGCPFVGPSIVVRHTLNRSSALSRFLNSRGLELPSSFGLAHKSVDSSWTYTNHLVSPDSSWLVQLGLTCLDGLWRLSLSAREGQRQTRLVADIPPELLCAAGRPAARMQVYFDQGRNLIPSGGIQVVSPPRPSRRTATDAAEVFVDGIFVPYVVYYDELGLFKDSFWEYSPLEIDINPASKNPVTLMTLNGIA